MQLLLRHELDHGGEVAVQVVHLVTSGVTNVGTIVELLNFDINTVMNAINYKRTFIQVVSKDLTVFMMFSKTACEHHKQLVCLSF